MQDIENIDNNVQNRNNMNSVINNLFNAKSFERNEILQLIDKIEIGAHMEYPKI